MRLRLALCILALASAAHGQTIIQPPGGGGVTPAISPSGSVAVGTVLTVPVVTGATCQWTRSGSGNISGATNCATYTTVTADGGHTVTEVITLTGVTVASSGSTNSFFFPQGEAALSLAQGIL